MSQSVWRKRAPSGSGHSARMRARWRIGDDRSDDVDAQLGHAGGRAGVDLETDGPWAVAADDRAFDHWREVSFGRQRFGKLLLCLGHQPLQQVAVHAFVGAPAQQVEVLAQQAPNAWGTSISTR